MNAVAQQFSRLTVSNRLLQVLTLIMFLFTSYAICLRAQGGYSRWSSDRQIQSLLHVIHAQQRKHYQASRSFASSLQTLRIHVPPGVQSSLFAGSIGGRPGFVAELCAEARCWAVNQHGEILARKVVPVVQFTELPSDPEEQAAVPAMEKVAGSRLEPGKPGIVASASTVADGFEVGAEPGVAVEGISEDHPPAAKPVQAAPSVVPKAPARAFGLKRDAVLPPLSPKRDSPALWGQLEEVHR